MHVFVMDPDTVEIGDGIRTVEVHDNEVLDLANELRLANIITAVSSRMPEFREWARDVCANIASEQSAWQELYDTARLNRWAEEETDKDLSDNWRELEEHIRDLAAHYHCPVKRRTFRTLWRGRGAAEEGKG